MAACRDHYFEAHERGGGAVGFFAICDGKIWCGGRVVLLGF
jgi:hypothetical protein